MNFWALCAISAHLNVIAKHPCVTRAPRSTAEVRFNYGVKRLVKRSVI